MEHDESDTPLKPAEMSSQAFHQPLDISRSECPQEALVSHPRIVVDPLLVFMPADLAGS